MSHGPNIVFILADDVGYGVLSSYNGGILDTPTARIDGLGSEGLRLTNFNVENQCTPSRRTLMTDPYAIRAGTHAVTPSGADSGIMYLDQNTTWNSCSKRRVGVSHGQETVSRTEAR
jgi:arylsulfatase